MVSADVDRFLQWSCEPERSPRGVAAELPPLVTISPLCNNADTLRTSPSTSDATLSLDQGPPKYAISSKSERKIRPMPRRAKGSGEAKFVPTNQTPAPSMSADANGAVPPLPQSQARTPPSADEERFGVSYVLEPDEETLAVELEDFLEKERLSCEGASPSLPSPSEKATAGLDDVVSTPPAPVHGNSSNDQAPLPSTQTSPTASCVPPTDAVNLPLFDTRSAILDSCVQPTPVPEHHIVPAEPADVACVNYPCPAHPSMSDASLVGDMHTSGELSTALESSMSPPWTAPDDLPITQSLWNVEPDRIRARVRMYIDRRCALLDSDFRHLPPVRRAEVTTNAWMSVEGDYQAQVDSLFAETSSDQPMDPDLQEILQNMPSCQEMPSSCSDTGASALNTEAQQLEVNDFGQIPAVDQTMEDALNGEDVQTDHLLQTEDAINVQRSKEQAIPSYTSANESSRGIIERLDPSDEHHFMDIVHGSQMGTGMEADSVRMDDEIMDPMVQYPSEHRPNFEAEAEQGPLVDSEMANGDDERGEHPSACTTITEPNTKKLVDTCPGEAGPSQSRPQHKCADDDTASWNLSDFTEIFGKILWEEYGHKNKTRLSEGEEQRIRDAAKLVYKQKYVDRGNTEEVNSDSTGLVAGIPPTWESKGKWPAHSAFTELRLPAMDTFISAVSCPSSAPSPGAVANTGALMPVEVNVKATQFSQSDEMPVQLADTDGDPGMDVCSKEPAATQDIRLGDEEFVKEPSAKQSPSIPSHSPPPPQSWDASNTSNSANVDVGQLVVQCGENNPTLSGEAVDKDIFEETHTAMGSSSPLYSSDSDRALADPGTAATTPAPSVDIEQIADKVADSSDALQIKTVEPLFRSRVLEWENASTTTESVDGSTGDNNKCAREPNPATLCTGEIPDLLSKQKAAIQEEHLDVAYATNMELPLAQYSGLSQQPALVEAVDGHAAGSVTVAQLFVSIDDLELFTQQQPRWSVPSPPHQIPFPRSFDFSQNVDTEVNGLAVAFERLCITPSAAVMEVEACMVEGSAQELEVNPMFRIPTPPATPSVEAPLEVTGNTVSPQSGSRLAVPSLPSIVISGPSDENEDGASKTGVASLGERPVAATAEHWGGTASSQTSMSERPQPPVAELVNEQGGASLTQTRSLAGMGFAQSLALLGQKAPAAGVTIGSRQPNNSSNLEAPRTQGASIGLPSILSAPEAVATRPHVSSDQTSFAQALANLPPLPPSAASSIAWSQPSLSEQPQPPVAASPSSPKTSNNAPIRSSATPETPIGVATTTTALPVTLQPMGSERTDLLTLDSLPDMPERGPGAVDVVPPSASSSTNCRSARVGRATLRTVVNGRIVTRHVGRSAASQGNGSAGAVQAKVDPPSRALGKFTIGRKLPKPDDKPTAAPEVAAPRPPAPGPSSYRRLYVPYQPVSATQPPRSPMVEVPVGPAQRCLQRKNPHPAKRWCCADCNYLLELQRICPRSSTVEHMLEEEGVRERRRAGLRSLPLTRPRAPIPVENAVARPSSIAGLVSRMAWGLIDTVVKIYTLDLDSFD